VKKEKNGRVEDEKQKDYQKRINSVIIIDRIYLAPFSVLEQTQCALVACNFEWLVECSFPSSESIGLLGTGAQDGHLDFNTAPELCDFE